MQLCVLGHDTYCYTGGKPFDAARPATVFVHGVLNDHSVWGLQTRYFAHHGRSVLAPDLPGHCRSAGAPPATVQAAADFILALMDAAGVERAALVGHSFGSLAALEAAARAPQRVTHLALLATAYPMKAGGLATTALESQEQAMALDNMYSHSTLAPPPSALGPGTWVPGLSHALMRRVVRSNPAVNVSHVGFHACDVYRGGEEAMARVRCPVLFLLGRQDQMTPPAAARTLQARAPQARTVVLDAGHNMMAERPDAVLDALREFFAGTPT